MSQQNSILAGFTESRGQEFFKGLGTQNSGLGTRDSGLRTQNPLGTSSDWVIYLLTKLVPTQRYAPRQR
jgi:hypothetical protein